MERTGTECQEEVFHRASDLRRLKNVLPSTTKKQLYNALVLPHMDYCSVVWQKCSRELRRKLERVQNYGIRLILSQPPRTHSEEMRQRLNWLTLEKRRVMARLCMMHRCVLKEYSMKSLSKSNSNGTRGVGKLFLPRPQTDFFKNSFTFKGIQDWNRLQSDVRTTINYNTFRSFGLYISIIYM